MGSNAVYYPRPVALFTQAPFLYQTRTLSKPATPIRWTFSHSRQRHTTQKLRGHFCQRQYTTEPSTISPTTNKSRDGRGFTIRRTSNVYDTGAGTVDRWEFGAKINDAQNGEAENASMRRAVGGGSPGRKGTSSPPHNGRSTTNSYSDIQFVGEVEATQSESIGPEEATEHYKYPKDEITELTSRYQERESTITDSERYAFQKIFADIFGRNLHANSAHREDHSDAPQGFNDTQPVDMTKAQSKLDTILSGAMQTQPRTYQEMESMVNKYPPALRAAAAKAIGLTEAYSDDSESSTLEGKELDTEQLEKLREPERARVESLMKSAETDFKLWEVMEKEVFSLIPKLGLEDPVKPIDEAKSEGATGDQKSKRTRRGKKADKTEITADLGQPYREASSVSNSAIISEGGISPLALYGPLYPSYLLLGLRLLDRSFAKPSTLTLSVLPKIKSLGLISQVLGASTQFYNELLRIHRYRYDGYRSILKLLSEMEISGLELDQETLEIVRDIQRAQQSIQRGFRGPVIQALWSLPEFAPNKFRDWEKKIEMAMNERA